MVGEKLAFLLDLHLGDGILLVGPRTAGWQEDTARYFAHSRWCEHTGDLDATERTSRLVVWDPSAEPAARLAPAAAALSQAAGPNGRLLMVGRNRWPPAILRRSRGSGRSESRWSLGEYRRALTGAGFQHVRTFLAMPNLSSWEEAVASQGEPVEFPPNAGLTARLSGILGISHWLHDGFVLIAGQDQSPLAVLEEKLTHSLTGVVTGARAVITRFGLRSRGALVLTLRGRETRGGVIVRVAVTPEVDRRISLNAECLERLLARGSISSRLRAWLPVPRGRSEVDEKRIYVEQRIEGHIAWQLVPGSMARARTDAEALHFINELARGTITRTGSNEPHLGDLFERAVERDFGPGIPAAARELALHVARALRTRLTVPFLPLVLGHGDFGYGNLIVGRTGDLRGVIDWDCSRAGELWGVDWCNYLIQRWRMDRNTALKAALSGVESSVKTVIDTGLWLEGWTPEERRAIGSAAFALAGLRYVARAARYPSEFRESADEYSAALEWLRDQRAP